MEARNLKWVEYKKDPSHFLKKEASTSPLTKEFHNKVLPVNRKLSQIDFWKLDIWTFTMIGVCVFANLWLLQDF